MSFKFQNVSLLFYFWSKRTNLFFFFLRHDFHWSNESFLFRYDIFQRSPIKWKQWQWFQRHFYSSLIKLTVKNVDDESNISLRLLFFVLWETMQIHWKENLLNACRSQIFGFCFDKIQLNHRHSVQNESNDDRHFRFPSKSATRHLNENGKYRFV